MIYYSSLMCPTHNHDKYDASIELICMWFVCKRVEGNACAEPELFPLLYTFCHSLSLFLSPQLQSELIELRRTAEKQLVVCFVLCQLCVGVGNTGGVGAVQQSARVRAHFRAVCRESFLPPITLTIDSHSHTATTTTTIVSNIRQNRR